MSFADEMNERHAARLARQVQMKADKRAAIVRSIDELLRETFSPVGEQLREKLGDITALLRNELEVIGRSGHSAFFEEESKMFVLELESVFKELPPDEYVYKKDDDVDEDGENVTSLRVELGPVDLEEAERKGERYFDTLSGYTNVRAELLFFVARELEQLTGLIGRADDEDCWIGFALNDEEAEKKDFQYWGVRLPYHTHMDLRDF